MVTDSFIFICFELHHNPFLFVRSIWHTLDPTHFIRAAEDLDIHVVGVLGPRYVEGDAPPVEPHASWLGMACLRGI